MLIRVSKLLLLVLSAFLVAACQGAEVSPPHVGIFLQTDVGLEEMEIYRGGPSPGASVGIPNTDNEQPTIIAWYPDLSLANLSLIFEESQLSVEYNAIPNDELVKIQPEATLTPGLYCLVQGDPLLSPVEIAHWCFRVGGEVVTSDDEPTVASATSPVASPTQALSSGAGSELSATSTSPVEPSPDINDVLANISIFETGQTYPSAAWSVETPIVVWSPDSNRLASFETGQAYLRDIPSGALLNTVEVYSPAVVTSPEKSGVAYLPNGDVVAWYHFSGSIILKNLLTGSDLPTLKGFGLEWSPDGLHVAVYNGEEISVLDTIDYTTGFTLLGHTNTIRDVSWNPDSIRLTSASSDGTIRIWDIAQEQEILMLDSNQDEVSEVSWSFDGNLLASVGNDAIQFWETITGGSLGGLLLEDPGRGTIQRVYWSPVDSKVVVRTGIISRVLLFEAPNGMESAVDIANGSVIGEIAWHPDGQVLAHIAKTVPSMNQLHAVTFWDTRTNSLLSTIIEPFQFNNGGFDPNSFTYLNSLAWSPNGEWLTLGGTSATSPQSSKGVIWLAPTSALGIR